MDLVIRKACEEDIDSIMEIELESFTTPWSREAFLKEINENKLAYYLVAIINNQIVGYAGMWLIVDESHITNVGVKRKYRGVGAGSKLLEGLIQICKIKEIGNMTLEVRKSNDVAKNLYEKYGFLEYGIRPRYYEDTGEDALIMWKKI